MVERMYCGYDLTVLFVSIDYAKLNNFPVMLGLPELSCTRTQRSASCEARTRHPPRLPDIDKFLLWKNGLGIAIFSIDNSISSHVSLSFIQS